MIWKSFLELVSFILWFWRQMILTRTFDFVKSVGLHACKFGHKIIDISVICVMLVSEILKRCVA